MKKNRYWNWNFMISFKVWWKQIVTTTAVGNSLRVFSLPNHRGKIFLIQFDANNSKVSISAKWNARIANNEPQKLKLILHFFFSLFLIESCNMEHSKQLINFSMTSGDGRSSKSKVKKRFNNNNFFSFFKYFVAGAWVNAYVNCFFFFTIHEMLNVNIQSVCIRLYEIVFSMSKLWTFFIHKSWLRWRTLVVAIDSIPVELSIEKSINLNYWIISGKSKRRCTILVNCTRHFNGFKIDAAGERLKKENYEIEWNEFEFFN